MALRKPPPDARMLADQFRAVTGPALAAPRQLRQIDVELPEASGTRTKDPKDEQADAPVASSQQPVWIWILVGLLFVGGSIALFVFLGREGGATMSPSPPPAGMLNAPPSPPPVGMPNAPPPSPPFVALSPPSAPSTCLCNSR